MKRVDSRDGVEERISNNGPDEFGSPGVVKIEVTS